MKIIGSDSAHVALALVHYPVKDRVGEVRATSVTPLNIHDLARSATTYGLESLYVVTPILSQQALAERILRHWRKGHGGTQNPSRRQSLEIVSIVDSVNDAAADLLNRYGEYPRLVGTAARRRDGARGYSEIAAEMLAPGRPWLILFGTGWGLTGEILAQCDSFLEPLEGRGEFNHLSVRSAAAIILDRLFGT